MKNQKSFPCFHMFFVVCLVVQHDLQSIFKFYLRKLFYFGFQTCPSSVRKFALGTNRSLFDVRIQTNKKKLSYCCRISSAFSNSFICFIQYVLCAYVCQAKPFHIRKLDKRFQVFKKLLFNALLFLLSSVNACATNNFLSSIWENKIHILRHGLPCNR